MREDRPIRGARLDIQVEGGAAAAGLSEVRSALDALAVPLARVSTETRLLAREQQEAHRQATELARTLGRTLPGEAGELLRSFRRTFQSESGLKGILRSFVSDARRLLASLFEGWLGGTGGSAGALAGIAGTGLGGPAFGGIGAGTPPFFPNAFPRSGTLSLPRLLSRLGINLRGIGGISGGTVFSGGLMLALAGHTLGGVGGALLGAGGGALTGFSVGGPIGAVIGGIAGLLGGIFGGGRGERKRVASDIANRGFAEIRELFARYQAFRLDYAEALARMNQLWSEMEARWREIGGSVGRQSITSQRPFFDQILRAIEEIERERQRRAGVLGAFPLPEFQAGGYVSGAWSRLGLRAQAGGSGLLALLHPGEFVMNRAAVEALGRPRLEEMNRGSVETSGGGPAFGGTGDNFHVSIIAADARGFEEMLRRNEDSLVRVIRRAARDRGRAGPL